MAILSDPPEWRVPGQKPPQNIIEVLGWEVASHPPAPWFNWFFNRVFESLLELEAATLARVINEAGVPGIMAGRESERPAASPETVGRIFIATDTKRIFRDMGGGWDLLNTPEAIGAETPAGAQAKAEAAASAALSGAQAYADQAVAAHAGRTDNPHQVTAAQLGLGDVLTHLAQILDSRIVDHNLDVPTPPNPPNGYYVRWQNGLQLCWTGIAGWGQQEGNKEDDIWVFLAAFKERPHVVGFPDSFNQLPVHFWIRQIRSDGNQIPFNESQVPISRYHLSTPNNFETVHLLAIGRWK